ncbi:VOC family protein [Geothrix edaphica]|uniref:Glyoxalase n=1 Tax=Geothrix edaphica TaxID=2927976 RepID=A0ABQ5Q223_9BACT|nr:VOC family protein [Geothrix edaphica]GLH68460.1 glyoxalase [Geothrix edaphica]
MAANPVAWFEIYVQDMDRALRFYESVLGVQLTRLEAPLSELQMWLFPSHMEGPGAGGALVKLDGCPSGGSGTLVYFHSEDCAIEEGRVVAAGGQIHRSKLAIGEFGFIALAHDTEGNMFGLHSLR